MCMRRHNASVRAADVEDGVMMMMMMMRCAGAGELKRKKEEMVITFMHYTTKVKNCNIV